MKVFKFDNCDFVCAETLEQAIEFYTKETHLNESEIEVHEVSLHDRTPVSPASLPDRRNVSVLDAVYINGKLYVYRSFAWVIKNEGITKPCIIASREV